MTDMTRMDADSRTLLNAIKDMYPNSVWLADVDDTLTDTSGTHEAASRAILDSLAPHIGETPAEQVIDRFVEIFDRLLASHQSNGRSRGEHSTADLADTLETRIAENQREIRERWGATKKFSREMLLKIAAEDHGISLTSQQLTQCADRYWHHIETEAEFFADALRLTQELKRVNSPLYLITSSDGRLDLKKNGQFSYDPRSSHRFKAARLERLRDRGLHFRQAFIGDPVDKPKIEFFENAYRSIEEDLGKSIDPLSIIVLGDSYKADIETPVSKLSATLGIWYQRGQKGAVTKTDKVVAVGSWDTVNEVLSTI